MKLFSQSAQSVPAPEVEKNDARAGAVDEDETGMDAGAEHKGTHQKVLRRRTVMHERLLSELQKGKKSAK